MSFEAMLTSPIKARHLEKREDSEVRSSNERTRARQTWTISYPKMDRFFPALDSDIDRAVQCWPDYYLDMALHKDSIGNVA